MPLLSLIFVQDLLRQSNSQTPECASTAKKWEASKATNAVIRCILTSDTQNLKTTGLMRIKLQTFTTVDTTRKPQKNDRKLHIFTTESRLLITALLPNFSHQLFKVQMN